MRDLADGESTTMKGSGRNPYVLKNTGGVYSCSCPAWRNQSVPIERRTCKHLRKLRGDDAEEARLGEPLSERALAAKAEDAPPLLLAHSWQDDHDPTGWWMSEKLDGVKAWWNGKDFISRLGNIYLAPSWFTADLPDFPLDGELWVGRKQFQKTVSVVRRKDESDHWRDVRYLVFDAPELKMPFEERLAALTAHFEDDAHPWASVLPHARCEGRDHLTAELARLEALGAEGLMLREPDSLYEIGRSTTLLKVKTFHDAEAKIVGYTKGAGRHKGRVGALQVISTTGVAFAVGTGLSDALRDDPPAIGSVITYRYQELTNDGVPRFPSYVGVRDDFAWPQSAPAAPPAVPSSATTSAATTSTSATATSTSATPSAPIEVAPLAEGDTRYLEYTDTKSAKFWEVHLEGDTVNVRYGRLGSDGRATSKTLKSAEAALTHANKELNKKLDKGYIPAEAPKPEPPLRNEADVPNKTPSTSRHTNSTPLCTKIVMYQAIVTTHQHAHFSPMARVRKFSLNRGAVRD